VVTAKLFHREIRRVIQGNIIDYNKTINYLKDNILDGCQDIETTKTYVILEVPEEQLSKEIFNCVEFYKSHNKKYAIFTDKEGESFILFQ